MWDATSTSPWLNHGKTTLAVLPVGALEQHGAHLPLGTDWMEADGIARKIAAGLNAYLLPALPFGNSQAHASFRGTVSLDPRTLARVVRELVQCLFTQGFKQVVVINTHGGNIVLKVTIRELNATYSDAKVILVHPWVPAIADLRKLFPDFDQDLHAGDFETSLMLALHPEWVGDDRRDTVPQNISGEFFDYLPINTLSKTGVWGRPSRASREKGQAALEVMAKKSVEYIRHTFQLITEYDTTIEPSTGNDPA